MSFQLFRPSRPGSFQPVRQNIWNVVLVLDLSQRVNLHVMAHTIGTLIQRGIPFRFGVVPLVGDEEDISECR
jgi:UDP-glucose:glycoprotein glucosyltransferase